MRIVIVSRIFTPEPAAASYLLHACATAFREAGHDVTVITSRAPRGLTGSDPEGVTVRRAPVKRDGQGYVRGYVSYMSFDIPAFFRLLFAKRADVYLVEPPPTTGAVVRVVGALRRTPYVYDAADLWSDAAVMATSNTLVLRVLRALERFAMRGARHAFAISDGLIERMREIAVDTPATAVGFGVDTAAFRLRAPAVPGTPLFVYGGSYNEWHGARVFLDAFEEVVRRRPDARLLFIGHGTDRPAFEARCRERAIPNVEFREPVPARELSDILERATASLASLKPDSGYEYAFTTKVYASLATGCPVIFSGAGPTGPFMAEVARHGPGGVAVEHDVDQVVAAMMTAADAPLSIDERRALGAWATERYALSSVAQAIVDGTERVVASSGRP